MKGQHFRDQRHYLNYLRSQGFSNHEKNHNLAALREISQTVLRPLAEGFEYVYKEIKRISFQFHFRRNGHQTAALPPGKKYHPARYMRGSSRAGPGDER